MFYTDSSSVRHTLAAAGSGLTALSGDVSASGSGSVSATVMRVNGVTYGAGPSTNTVPVVTAANTVTYETLPNAALTNSSVTLGTTNVPLGAVASSLVGLTNVGIGTTAPGSMIDVAGAETMRGMSAPAVAPVGQGRFYFDSTTNTFQVSQNGGAYVSLVSSGSTANFASAAVNSGSQAAPSLTFSGDSGTGFYDAGTNAIGVANNGVESMMLSSAGIAGTGAMSVFAGGSNQNLTLGGSGTGAVIMNPNVGIGTTAPGNISIFGKTRTVALMQLSITRTHGNTAGVGWYLDNGTSTGGMSIYGPNFTSFGESAWGGIR